MLTSLLSALDPVLLVGQSGSGGGGFAGLLLPLVLIIGVFYFFIYRPQQKREEEHQEMVDNLEQGDKIVTVGGIHGTVQTIDEDSVLAQVDSKGTRLRFDKDSIASLANDEE
ncbi:MAG: preprotein translocase subunit YajC [Bacteroidetes bacterium QH_7_64_110]|jgi:preprotein translocase subunit YajC|nr:MAG: preprotein translocase subunit YajC [Bacteroidetes bacterium QH_1_64_81]PSQ74002.1 MAG: preprotein translocase subunit YajC [Bacteroidetes bacterium QH_7_64_110]